MRVFFPCRKKNRICKIDNTIIVHVVLIISVLKKRKEKTRGLEKEGFSLLLIKTAQPDTWDAYWNPLSKHGGGIYLPFCYSLSRSSLPSSARSPQDATQRVLTALSSAWSRHFLCLKKKSNRKKKQRLYALKKGQWEIIMQHSIQTVQNKWRNLVISCGWMDYFLYCCVAYNRAYNVTLSLSTLPRQAGTFW